MDIKPPELVCTQDKYKILRRFERDGSCFYALYIEDDKYGVKEDRIYGIASKLKDLKKIMLDEIKMRGNLCEQI